MSCKGTPAAASILPGRPAQLLLGPGGALAGGGHLGVAKAVGERRRDHPRVLPGAEGFRKIIEGGGGPYELGIENVAGIQPQGSALLPQVFLQAGRHLPAAAHGLKPRNLRRLVRAVELEQPAAGQIKRAVGGEQAGGLPPVEGRAEQATLEARVVERARGVELPPLGRFQGGRQGQGEVVLGGQVHVAVHHQAGSIGGELHHVCDGLVGAGQHQGGHKLLAVGVAGFEVVAGGGT